MRYRPRLKLLLPMILAAFGSFGMASEEEIPAWKSVRVECEDVPEAGKIVFAAASSAGKFSSCEVSAFGTPHKLAGPELEKLRNFSLDGLRITHEAGYPQLGGHTVHFKLRRVAYSAREKTTVVEDLVISVSKGKGLAVDGPTRRE